MRKGFTIIEILLSIILVSAIFLFSILFFRTNNKDENKLYDIVSTSAQTDFMMSSEKKELIKQNNGIYVYSVNELINEGLMDEQRFNALLKKLNLQDDENYKKIIAFYNYLEDGLIEFTYPYEKNKNVFLEKLSDIVFYKSNSNNIFNCENGIDFISFFDENYVINVKNVNDLEDLKFYCKIQGDSEYKESIVLDVNSSLDYKVSFKLNNILYIYETLNHSPREVSVVDLEFLRLRLSGSKYNNYYGSDVGSLLELNDEQFLNYDDNLSLKWTLKDLDNNIIKTKIVSDNLTSLDKIMTYFDIEKDSTYNLKLEIIEGTQTKRIISKDFKIDITSPKVFDVEYNLIAKNLSFKAADDSSGVKLIEIKSKNGQILKTYNNTNDLSYFEFINISNLDKDCKIVVTDYVNNKMEYLLRDVPYVEIKPIEGSVFDFILSYDKLKTIKIDFYLETEYVNGRNDTREDVNYSLLSETFTSNNVNLISGTKIYSLYDFAATISNVYNKGWVYYDFPSLDNFSIKCKLSVLDKANNERIYNYKIKLNGYATRNPISGISIGGFDWADVSAMRLTPNNNLVFVYDRYGQHRFGTSYLYYWEAISDSLNTLVTNTIDHDTKDKGSISIKSVGASTIKYEYKLDKKIYNYNYIDNTGVEVLNLATYNSYDRLVNYLDLYRVKEKNEDIINYDKNVLLTRYSDLENKLFIKNDEYYFFIRMGNATESEYHIGAFKFKEEVTVEKIITN